MLSAKGKVERETGLEPATFSLEGLSGYALWHASWRGEHFVSSYRVFVCARTRPCDGAMGLTNRLDPIAQGENYVGLDIG